MTRARLSGRIRRYDDQAPTRHLDRADAARALRLLRRAYELDRKLAETHPDVAAYQSSWALDHSYLAKAYLLLGKTAQELVPGV